MMSEHVNVSPLLVRKDAVSDTSEDQGLPIVVDVEKEGGMWVLFTLGVLNCIGSIRRLFSET